MIPTPIAVKNKVQTTASGSHFKLPETTQSATESRNRKANGATIKSHSKSFITGISKYKTGVANAIIKAAGSRRHCEIRATGKRLATQTA